MLRAPARNQQTGEFICARKTSHKHNKGYKPVQEFMYLVPQVFAAFKSFSRKNFHLKLYFSACPAKVAEGYCKTCIVVDSGR